MDIHEIFSNIQSKYNYLVDKGYEVFGVYLQGSQNYKLDVYDEDYKSDVDVKAIVIPSLKDLIHNKKLVSTTIELENKEHIDVKDIRLMFDCFYKQNINFIEILFTDYKIINPKYEYFDKELRALNEMIAHYDYKAALNCMAGMAMQKLCALKHPYLGLIDKINKFGYDPKQLHHIVRMKDFIEKYTQGIPYKECLIPSNPQELIEIKKGKYSLEDAEKIAKQTVDCIFKIKDTELKCNQDTTVNTSVKNKLDKIIEAVLIVKFINELNELKLTVL